MPPQTFQCDGVEWRKVRVLGKGSFGEAYLIEATSSSGLPRAQAVCKLVHLAAMKKDEQREALNEVRVLSQLKHPNIVQYMGSFQADGYLHILMEYCNAGDVDQLIKKRQSANNKMLEEEVIASVFIQVCSALRYLHERRILHRDLKSQNIFLCQAEASRDGKSGKLVAKLGDFGISTVLRNTLALAKTVCGTPYYFSPELCLNRPYNNKSDVWSLGCILYEMATLKHAFDANNMKALMQRILTGKYAPIDSMYHRSLQEVIDGMLQQKVEKRMSIQQVQKTQFVVQHTERLYQQHELESSLKRKEKERVEAQRHAAATEEPNVRMVSGMKASPRPRHATDRDERAKAALERRQEQEQQLVERKQSIEEQRRRKNLRAAQHYDRHREHIREKMLDLERLDDVRRRIEICSYEDQEKYTQQGWKVVQETKERQQERSKGHEERDKKLQELMEQMQAIDEKMQSRKVKREHQAPSNVAHLEKINAPQGLPPRPARAPTARELALAYKNRVSAEAPWNRNRSVPVGFTQDSWDAHCQVMGHAIPIGASPAPNAPARRETLHAGEAVAPPSKGQLSEVEASAILRVEQERLSKDPRFQEHQLAMEEARRKKQAQLEWDEHKKRIRAAELLQQEHKPTTVNESAVAPPCDRPVLEPRVHVQTHQPCVPKPCAVNTNAGYRVDNCGRYREDAQVPYRSNPAEAVYEDDSCGSGHSSACSSPRSLDADSSSVASDLSDSYSDVIDAMKEQYLRPDPPEMFEEAPLPANDISRVANTMKFTLDGKTLQLDGVGISDPPRARVEALRVFLIDALGGQRSLERLIRSLQEIQGADVDETLADAMLAKLEQQYGQKKSLVDLAIQLIVCEAMLDAQ